MQLDLSKENLVTIFYALQGQRGRLVESAEKYEKEGQKRAADMCRKSAGLSYTLEERINLAICDAGRQAEQGEFERRSGLAADAAGMTEHRQEQQEDCEACGGDGLETCSNPDHGFLDAMSFHDVGRNGCPVCGTDPKHKTKAGRNGAKCEDCNGTGKQQAA